MIRNTQNAVYALPKVIACKQNLIDLMHSLKRLVWLAFTVVGGLLVCVSLLGIYQYQLSSQYNTVIGQNERALFHFMTIRESVTESLITKNWKQLTSILPDLEKLNSELSRLKENQLVAPELKLALVDKIDIAGLVILIRQVVNGDDRTGMSNTLQAQMRAIADYLIQYDRIIVGQARSGIVDFQMVVIGILGLIISLASFSLIFLNRNTVSPLLQLSHQLQSGEIISAGVSLDPPMIQEVADLAEGIQKLTVEAKGSHKIGQLREDTGAEMILVADTINETTNQLNGMINYAQLLCDSDGSTAISAEQKEMLQKIIDSGGKIAKEWQKINRL